MIELYLMYKNWPIKKKNKFFEMFVFETLFIVIEIEFFRLNGKTVPEYVKFICGIKILLLHAVPVKTSQSIAL